MAPHARPVPSRASLVISCASALLVAMSGCTSAPADTPESTRTRAIAPHDADDAASPTPTTEPPPLEEDLSYSSDAVCAGDKVYNLDSAPYQGEGPHPMTPIIEEGPEDLWYLGILLPPAWDPLDSVDTSDGKTPQHKKVQLVVCDAIESTGDKVGTCPYDIGEIDLVNAVHRIVVREARTGRLVTEFTMESSPADPDFSCPASVYGPYDTRIAQPADDQVVARELRPFYLGTAEQP